MRLWVKSVLLLCLLLFCCLNDRERKEIYTRSLNEVLTICYGVEELQGGEARRRTELEKDR